MTNDEEQTTRTYRGFTFPFQAALGIDLSAIVTSPTRANPTYGEILSLAMRSGAWDKSSASMVSAPVVRYFETCTKAMKSSFDHLDVAKDAQGRIINAWMYLVALRRLADFGNWSAPEHPFRNAASRLLGAFTQDAVPEPDQRLMDEPRLFRELDFSRIFEMTFAINPHWQEGC